MTPENNLSDETEHAAEVGEAENPSDAEATEPSVDAEATPVDRPVAPREYYSIGEVCELVDLKPHVLRYWESQFPILNPSKNRSGNRVYRRKEIKLVLLVKHLLYKEKYTIEGTKRRLEQLRRGGEIRAAASQALDREMIALLRGELRQVLDILTLPGES